MRNLCCNSIRREPPRGHLAGSVGRKAGSKTKNRSDVVVWKLAAVTFGQRGEIRRGYSKRPLYRTVALRVRSVTCGAILFVDLPAGWHIVRRKLVLILCLVSSGTGGAYGQDQSSKQNYAVLNHKFAHRMLLLPWTQRIYEQSGTWPGDSTLSDRHVLIKRAGSTGRCDTIWYKSFPCRAEVSTSRGGERSPS